jgi:hypothetical protein
MLRRCLESPSHRFGMMLPPRTGQAGPSEFGTMLEIRSVQVLPDGRSMVETWGTQRFRVVERGTLDGYMVARVELFDDFADELPDAPAPPEPASALAPPPVPSNNELMAVCRAFLEQLRAGTAPWVVQRLSHTYGPMPRDAARFSFWMALVRSHVRGGGRVLTDGIAHRCCRSTRAKRRSCCRSSRRASGSGSSCTGSSSSTRTGGSRPAARSARAPPALSSASHCMAFASISTLAVPSFPSCPPTFHPCNTRVHLPSLLLCRRTAAFWM